MCTALPNTRAVLERNDCGTPLSIQSRASYRPQLVIRVYVQCWGERSFGRGKSLESGLSSSIHVVDYRLPK